jgi:hypothetical protein
MKQKAKKLLVTTETREILIVRAGLQRPTPPFDQNALDIVRGLFDAIKNSESRTGDIGDINYLQETPSGRQV